MSKINSDILFMDTKIFGSNLQALREDKNLRYEAFGELIQYDRNTLSCLEGGFQNIQFQTAVRIAKNLDKDLAMLFSRSFRDDEKRCQSKKYSDIDYLAIFRANAIKRLTTNQMNVTDISEEHRETVSRILNGHITNPRIGTLSLIAHGLDTSLCALLTPPIKKE
ncbi:MAG: helix-turn-helix transcriptional regulator [Lachnospiraceae bacterium]|nr:helix-turn-helix transcriptional regulator [Lachnospiraceae bacterium]